MELIVDKQLLVEAEEYEIPSELMSLARSVRPAEENDESVIKIEDCRLPAMLETTAAGSQPATVAL